MTRHTVVCSSRCEVLFEIAFSTTMRTTLTMGSRVLTHYDLSIRIFHIAVLPCLICSLFSLNIKQCIYFEVLIELSCIVSCKLRYYSFSRHALKIRRVKQIMAVEFFYLKDFVLNCSHQCTKLNFSQCKPSNNVNSFITGILFEIL